MSRAGHRIASPARAGVAATRNSADDAGRSLGALAAAAPSERLSRLRSRAAGLDEAEVIRRRRELGANEPVRPEARRAWIAFLSNFTHTLALLLWFAAGLAFAGGAPELGAAIIAVVLVNGVFAFFQEHRAERVVASLARRVSLRARVVRAGVERSIPASDLVPGDVVRLRAGDIAPADLALLSSDELALDLSLVTGESAPVERRADAVPGATDRTPLIDLESIAPAGAAVLTGSAIGVVAATGPESTMGKVASLIEAVHRGPSLLERRIAELSRITAVIAVCAGAATLAAVGLVTHTSFIVALTFGTGVIVALVPEGLLPTLSVALAVGARRMATRGAAIRRLTAVEIVGSVTVVCTDKTGTLTENSVAVVGFVGAGARAGEEARARLAAVLCNDARASADGFEGDALDVALARWAALGGVDCAAERRRCPRVADVPFDARRRYMSVTCAIDGRRLELAKGAPEAILALTRGAALPAPIERALADATARGERVLLLAAGDGPGQLEPLGLLRLHDPPRKEVPAAIAACRRAGIRVVMLTGDHAATARAIAATIGLGDDHVVVEGRELETMSDAEIVERLRRDAVVARIDPAGKLRIVEVLRAAGEIVVVTGDGINDAPALRAADVGVAMGRRGTEVAKQAADVVLADDNFATIVAAIEEGRAIRANIRRFVSYVFTSNVAELVPYVLFVLLPIPLPLAIVQVLAIDLGTDLLPALGLGMEPPSPGTMRAPPEPATSPLLTRALGVRTFLFFGAIEAVLGMGAFLGYYATRGWRPFEPLAAYDAAIAGGARTLTFLGIVAGQIGCLFAQRDGRIGERLSLRDNAWIGAGLAFEIALALVLVYVPGLNRVFSMTAVHPAWLLVLPAGAAVFLILDGARRGASAIRVTRA